MAMSFLENVAVLLGEHRSNPENEEIKEQYEQCRDMLLRFKEKEGTTLVQLEAQLDASLESAEVKAAKAAKALERKAENDAKAVVIVKVEAANTLEEARALLSEVTAFGERYSVTLTAKGFSTNLKVAARGGNTGSGRPGRNDPSGFAVASTGEAILGGFNTWVKEQIKADAFSSEVEASLYGPTSGKLKAKAKTSKILVKAGEVIAVEAIEPETSDDATVEAEAA